MKHETKQWLEFKGRESIIYIFVFPFFFSLLILSSCVYLQALNSNYFWVNCFLFVWLVLGFIVCWFIHLFYEILHTYGGLKIK